MKGFRDYLEKALSSTREGESSWIKKRSTMQTGKRGGHYHLADSGAKVYEHGITMAGTLAQAHSGGRYFSIHASLATLAGAIKHPDHFYSLPQEARRHFKSAARVLQGHEIADDLGLRSAGAYQGARSQKHGHKTASAQALDQVHADINKILGDRPGAHEQLTQHMAEGIAHTIKGWAPQHEFLSDHLKDLSQKVTLTSPGKVKEHMGAHLGGVLTEQKRKKGLGAWLQSRGT